MAKINDLIDLMIQHTGNDELKTGLEKLRAESAPPSISSDLDTRIHKLLSRLGVPANLNGYGYLHCAIGLALSDKCYLHKITGLLYPAIATQYDTTPSRVERAMRHAIGCSSDRAGYDEILDVFGNCTNPQKGVLCNSEFIAGAVKYLNLGLDCK